MKVIPDDMLHVVCKMGKGVNTCRYIMLDPDKGICCAKHSEFKSRIDERAEMSMVAKGDNCEGLS